MCVFHITWSNNSLGGIERPPGRKWKPAWIAGGVFRYFEKIFYIFSNHWYYSLCGIYFEIFFSDYWGIIIFHYGILWNPSGFYNKYWVKNTKTINLLNIYRIKKCVYSHISAASLEAVLICAVGTFLIEVNLKYCNDVCAFRHTSLWCFK